MKTIKELEAEKKKLNPVNTPRRFSRCNAKIEALKDVLGLINEMYNATSCTTTLQRMTLEELKKRITG